MNRALLAGLVVLVLGALVWGFSVVGGPGYARMERNDAQRAGDLQRLGEYYRCAEYDPEPDTQQEFYCAPDTAAPPDLRDPVTDEPYRYTRTGENVFEVCAIFETEFDEDSWRTVEYLKFEGQEGCMRYVRDDAGDVWKLE